MRAPRVQLGPVRVEGATESGSWYSKPVDGTALTEGTGSYTVRGPNAAATGLGLTLRETPQSMTVFTRQRIEDQALNSLGSVLDQTPGISHSHNGGPGGFTYAYSRGYLVNNFIIDGLPSGSGAVGGGGGYEGLSSLDSAIYDSITVLRGAAGLLHSTGDPSGSVSLTRKRPTREFQASVEAGLGSWDKRRAVADVSGPLNSTGTVRGRLVGAYDEGGSWKDRYSGESKVAYGVFEADLSSATLVRLALEHQQTESRGNLVNGHSSLLLTDGSRAPLGVSTNLATRWSRYDLKRTNVSARVEHRFNENWSALLDYSYSKFDSGIIMGQLFDLNPDGTSLFFGSKEPVDQNYHALNAKITGTYELFGQSHDLVFGFNADWLNNKMSTIDIVEDASASWQGWNGSGILEPDWASYTTDLSKGVTKNNGLYLTTRVNVTDGLSLLAGARWSNWKTKVTDQRTGLATDDRSENGVITPYAAVMYDLTSQLSAYASYTGIFNPQSTRDLNDNLLDPERGYNVELGLKGEWFDGRLNASAAIFQFGKDNLAVEDGSNLTPGGDQAYRAVDDTKGRGWELEVSGELAQGWNLQGGYTRIVLKDSAGNLLQTQNQPRHMVKVFTAWTPARLNKLTIGSGLRWQSKVYDEWNPADLTQKGYTLVDFMARYSFSNNLNISVNVNNALNKTYLQNRFLADAIYGAPRNAFVALRAKF